MKQRTPIAASVLAALLLTVPAAPASAGDGSEKIVDFDTMVGVTRPFTGNANPIRGVPGGGLPWSLNRIQGTLRADGRLDIDVRGLVLADDPAVAPERRLTNPIASFRGLVSCQTKDAADDAAFVNVATDNFPATPTGDARIVATVTLPTPCIAPIVFVTNPNGAWFAATGH